MKLNKDIQLNKLLNVLVFSSFVVFIWVFLSKLLTYFYRIVIARYFGAEQYGLFSLASMIFILFVHLISLGLPEGLVRYISLYRGKKQYKNIKIIFDKSFSLLVLIGILGGLIMFFLSSWISLNIFHEEKLIVFVRIASLAIPFFVISNLYLSVLKSFERVGWYSFLLNFFQKLSKLFSLLIFIFFPGSILNFLFGSEYLVAENALRLLAFGSLFGSLSVVPAHLISMTGKSKKILSINIFMLILNFVLNFILVPRYGISGAAFSTMIIFL